MIPCTTCYTHSSCGGGVGVGGMPPLPMPRVTASSTFKQPIIGTNYIRQVLGVLGDEMLTFSFLGVLNLMNKLDFVRDAMKNEKK